MDPSVPAPKEFVGKSIDVKLKPGWRYDEARAVFVGPKGETAAPASLPKGARIVYKVPSLAHAKGRSLSAAERDLGRYLQVILPAAGGAERLAPLVNAWPAIEEAYVTPNMSLPAMGQ